jgi:hypothetical protein
MGLRQFNIPISKKKKGGGQWKHELTTLQGGCKNIEVRCIKYKRFLIKLPYQIQATRGDVGGQ